MAGLNYNHLRYFWTVAREGHLGRAAQRLNLTQSALSVQIKRLEEHLGHQLPQAQCKRAISPRVRSGSRYCHDMRRPSIDLCPIHEFSPEPTPAANARQPVQQRRSPWPDYPRDSA